MKKKLLALLLCVAMLLPSVAYAVPLGGINFSASAVKDLVSTATDAAEDGNDSISGKITASTAKESDQPVETVVNEAHGLDQKYEQFTDVSASGVGVAVVSPAGAFDEGAALTVTDTTLPVPYSDRSTVKGIVAVDISFDGQQPSERVAVSLDIPDKKIPRSANMVYVVHMAEDGPEVCATYYLDNDPGEKIAFSTDGFSTYAAIFVDGKYSSQKMSQILAGDSRYSISEFNVDLFDYDPVTINNALNDVTSDGNGFHFTGYGITGMGSNSGINNSASGFAKQGILENELVNGLPVIKHLNGTDAGVNSGKVLFSADEYTSSKTIYNDIPFEFIYDEQTGFYEYKSSANHAQLNKGGTKVELYADTLSTQNAYVWSADLSAPIGASDLTNATATASSYKATVSDANGNERLDPYVLFAVNDIDASTVGQIYVRAKVPAAVGANGFQLFFTTAYASDGTTPSGWSEPQSFGNPEYSKAIPYTATGDWIEFVVDTSENPNWSDTAVITGVRVDLFDGNKGTLDYTKTFDIEIDQIRFIQKDYDAYATRGGFYPFSEIEDSYPGNNTKFTYDEWSTLIQNSTITTNRASRAIYNPAPDPATDLYSELAYGMVMEYDYYLPVDRTGDDLTYYFNGDDDLWVFVDGKLALDIGGGHGAITGKLNFSTGDVEVESAVTVTGYNSGVAADQTTGSKVSGKMAEELYAPGKHTMKIFYLERGGSVSNCFMKFNLPRTPQGSVTVSKNVAETTGASLNVLSQEVFEFTVEMKNHAATGDFQTKAPLANKSFYIVNADDSTVDSETDANGKFYLKHGQKAVFEIAENYEVSVTETPKSINGYDHISTTVNGTDVTNEPTLTQLTEEGEEKVFAFVNTYTERQATLTYIPVNPDGCPADMKGTVELTGNAASKTSDVVGVSETIGVRLGVPAGSTATDSLAVEFVGWYSDAACEDLISSDKAYLPTKAVGNELWTDATYYAKFVFKYGDLTVSKNGIEDIDNHGQNAFHEDEKQNSIFKITGTSHAGQEIDMTITIIGNGSATIRQLPVGEYFVTEMPDWSWRYEPADAVKDVTLTTDGATVSFINERENIYWLSGDNWIQNLLSKNIPASGN